MKNILPSNIQVVIAGMLLPLSFAPFHYYPIALVSLIVLFSQWGRSHSPKQAALQGFLFGLGFFGVGVSWVFVAINEFGQSGVILASLLTSLFVSFLALYLGVLGWIIKRIAPHRFVTADYVLLLPLSWLIFEAFKGWFLTGFPWLELGAGQIDGPLAGYTPVMSVLGVSLLTAFTAGLLLSAWQSKRWWPLLVVLVIWSSGEIFKSQQWTQAEGEPLKASIIQGNVPQEIKWEPEQLYKTLALYQARTEAHWDSDVIVWPENAIPVFYHQVKEIYFDPLRELAIQNNTELLIGLPILDKNSGDYYNSIMQLGKQEGYYFKRHLVPFGDYVPFEWLRGVIKFFDLPMSAFRPGPYNNELLSVAGHPIGLSICYEDTFSSEMLASMPKARFLVNATNNAWYGDSFAPHQHLQISRNRALEMGRPILRATTNGISAFIDHKGDLVEQTAQFQEAVLTSYIQPRTGATPYVKWRHIPLWLLALFMGLAWMYHRHVVLNNQAK